MTRFSETLRDENADRWNAALHHRFVRELGAGTVPDGVMADYLVQDHRFVDDFLALLGAAIASSDRFEARLPLARFAGLVAGEENTYFLRAFAALGLDEADRQARPDKAPTQGFRLLMREAAASRSYAGALAVLCVAEGLYLEWAESVPRPLPENFVHAEWVTLHDNEGFALFVAFLRDELDRVGPAESPLCRDLFRRAVELELRFFDAAFEGAPS